MTKNIITQRYYNGRVWRIVVHPDGTRSVRPYRSRERDEGTPAAGQPTGREHGR